MNRTTLIAAACALLVVTTGVAVAAPGNAPVDAGENSADERDDRVQNGSADGGVDERGAGPNGDLPEQVPDHVSAIHERISSFLDGDLEGSLGDAISEVTPGDDDADDADDAEDADDADDADDAVEDGPAEEIDEDDDVADDDGSDAGGNESDADE